MKFITLLIIVTSFISCDDQITQNKNTVTSQPAACEELPNVNRVINFEMFFPGIQSVTDISSSSVRVNWEHSPQVDHFNIISMGANQDQLIQTVFNPATHTFVNGLKPDTTYTFLIRAMDKSGKVDFNDKTITFRTLPEVNFSNSKSLKFNGTQFVNLGPSSNYNMAGGKTVSLWFKPSDYTVNHKVFVDRLFTFYHTDTASTGLSVGIQPNKLLLIYTNKRNIQKSIKVKIKGLNGKWNHLVATSDNQQISLYLNGEEILQMQDNLKSFGSHEAKLGAFNHRFAFRGLIDEFAFYGAPLNEMEVKDLYNNGAPQDLTQAVKKERLTVWYRMGDHQNDGTNHLEDIKGNHHGTPRSGDTFDYEADSP